MQQKIILQLKEPYVADPNAALTTLAQVALDLFGKGGNPEAEQIEDYLGYVNTPVQGPGYVRVLVDEEFAGVIRQIGENEIARYIEDEPSWEEDVLDENSQPTGETRTAYLGRIV